MANADACKPDALFFAGDKLSAKEIDEVLKELRKRQKELLASETIVNDQDAALRAAEEFAKEAELAAIIVKRNEALNLQARNNLLSYVGDEWADRPVDGLEAALVGVQRARTGARRSVAAEQRAQFQFYLGGMVTELQRAGVREAFASGALDREVANALFNIADEAALARLNPDAVKIAKIVNEWQERARVDANKAGAWIKKLPGYIVRQSHDARKIDLAGLNEWKAYIRERLDIAKTFGEEADVDKALDDVWNGLSTGVHLTSGKAEVSGFKGYGNLAKKLSQERVLHFKDADTWFEYNERFGSGNIREAVAFGLSKFAQSTALMRTLGTNPEANLDTVFKQLQRNADQKQLKELSAARERIFGAFLPQLDGRARQPANHFWARFMANARAIESMAKLGGAVLSSITDLPMYAAEMRYQGKGMFSGLGEAIGGLRGRRDQVSQETLASLGVFFESTTGDLISRFSADDTLSGKMSRAMRLYFKANLQSIWTDSLRASAGLATSNHLAQHTGLGWVDLPDELRNVMRQYGIDSDRWDLMRLAKLKEHDGRKFLEPSTFDGISDMKLAAYLKRQNLPVTGRALDNLRDDLARQLRLYVSDRVDYAVINPDTKTRAYMLGGEKPGTFAGELRRLIFQFKAFPAAVIQRGLGRELLGRGSDSLGQALKNGNGELVGFANMLLWTTLFGYGAMAMKDVAKGREPRTGKDAESWARLTSAAMLQGGALGLYGDFLLGESSRFGRSVLESLGGPVLGVISDADKIRVAAMQGEDIGAQSFRAIVNNTPGINLFYTRAALDYLFLYQIQEYLNPGSVRRMERRVERENNQSFIIPPSAVVN